MKDIKMLESHAIDKSGSVGHKSKEATHRDIEIDMITDFALNFCDNINDASEVHGLYSLGYRVIKVEE